MTSGNPLAGYSVYDSKEKTILYRLKTKTNDIDTIILVDNSTKNIVGNLEGEWTDLVKVTLSLYDNKLNKWIDGTINMTSGFFITKYPIEWNGFRLIMKQKNLSRTRRLYDEQKDDFLAKFQPWFQLFRSPPSKYNLKIYSNKIPDTLYFLILAMADQRERMRTGYG